MSKLPNSDQDLSNAYLYVELQKKGLNHNEILAKLIEVNGAYSESIGDHVSAVKADHDNFVKNKYSNPEIEKHDINELQKDLGPIPALKKFKNFFHSVVEMLDDGSFEVDLFKTEKDYEENNPSEIVNLTPMLELDVAASLNEDQIMIATIKDELKQLPYIDLAKAIHSHTELELDLTDEEVDVFAEMIHQAHGEMYDEACEDDGTAEGVHPKDKGKPEKKLQKIKESDLEDLRELAGTGITNHAIRSEEASGLAKPVIEMVEKALVAAANRNFQKWVAKRDKGLKNEKGQGVRWGKAAESHAEFANYATSKHMEQSADELLEIILDKDLADDPQGAYKEALNFFDKDIVEFIKRSGPAAYQEGIENWYQKLWGDEKPAQNDEFSVDEDYMIEDVA